MSDILIRGIEKPKSCRVCPFRQETYLLTRQVCIANHNEELCTGIDKIDESCPLFPVAPHGDLIDKDEYRDEFMNGVYALCSDDSDNYRANAIIDLFDEAPTIIPASE